MSGFSPPRGVPIAPTRIDRVVARALWWRNRQDRARQVVGSVRDQADSRELLQRYPGNPILGPRDFPMQVNSVFNPGATIIEGRTLLLLRVEHRTGLSSLVAATSDDGLTGWEIDPTRGLEPQPDGFEEHWGIEDPRITRVGEEYFVVYVGLLHSWATRLSRQDPRFPAAGSAAASCSRPRTRTPRSSRRPSRGVGRSSTGLHRRCPAWAPTSGSRSAPICATGVTPVCCSRRGTVAGGTPTRSGSVHRRSSPKTAGCVCYHAVRVTASGSIYRLGLALLDRDDPTRVVARGKLVDLRSPGALRTLGRRARRRLPVRLDPSRRRRHSARLLRRRGQRRLRGRGEPGETVGPPAGASPLARTKRTRTRWTRAASLRAEPFEAPGPPGASVRQHLDIPTPVAFRREPSPCDGRTRLDSGHVLALSTALGLWGQCGSLVEVVPLGESLRLGRAVAQDHP